jgi:uncharacterized protein (UPF0276 family)
MASRVEGAAPGIGRAGIGLREPHVAEVMATRPDVGWLEVHAENYMSRGASVRALELIRRDYSISLHGVGLSLGSAEELDHRHLDRLGALAERVQPRLISEHLAWSGNGGAYLNHLLPLPYDEEVLGVVAHHVDEMQSRLGRRVLVENPSSYLRFNHSSMSEVEFLVALVQRTGCGLLCDVNNIFVSAHNVGLDAEAYLDALPLGAIGEIHLAGHTKNDASGQSILIDDHGSAVADAVWALYARALRRFGPVPSLVEWDTELPALSTVLAQARRADEILRSVSNEGSHASAA